MKRLETATKRLAAADEKRDELARKRDDDIRAAHAADATWADMRKAGVSNATIAKALGNKATR